LQVAGSGTSVSVDTVEAISDSVVYDERRDLVIPADTTSLKETTGWDADQSTLRSSDGISCSGE
jgi:hypothetical protein